MQELKPSDTTVIDWGKRPEHLDENLEKCLNMYQYLSDEKYLHKREQLYLMLQQGRSGKFVNAFFKQDTNILSLDLDFLRGLALLINESFVLERFYKKNFTLEEAREILMEYFSEMRYDKFPKIEELLKEQERLKDQFSLQIEFLQKEQENIKEYGNELLKKEQEKADLQRELQKQTMQGKIDKLETQRQELESQAVNLQKENEKLREEKEAQEQEKMMKQEEQEFLMREQKRLTQLCQDLRERIFEMEKQGESDKEKERTSYFQTFFRKRSAQKIRQEKEERNNFLMGVICDPKYSKEQLEIIIRLAKTAIPLEKLQMICNPKLEIENMEILEQYYKVNGNEES